MTVKIDALGKACPTPVILAKQAIDGGVRDLTISVDNDMAVQNLSRLAQSQHMTAQAVPISGGFDVHITGEGGGETAPETVCCPAAEHTEDCTFFIGKDHIGEGDGELGRSLMKMFLYTLTQRAEPPRALLFMNSGVRLPAGEAQIVESLQALEKKGCEILVCGTCLNFYNLAGELKVGTVSNMYDIVERMDAAAKVVTV
ncbi:sulfurtransferase-like selenium metabolism protein YedF [Oscillibacter sp.]|uniref:sulfurtransferase-like selenium metabolism protein YedF n=1 Tax=Oscillibacter sp. TaxID=1945593 RepID=UPI00261E6E2A|nr:sulfurtransferase-like selenium metabolism protein YedF [Oscillibacter sp.]MDD3346591.1 sulfurtransferase-like selenium metabolism protein YedF [Oscillibacter sp.]